MVQSTHAPKTTANAGGPRDAMGLHLDPVEDAMSHGDRLASLADAYWEVHQSMISDALAAWETNPDAPLQTPRYDSALRSFTPAWEVFADDLSGSRATAHGILVALQYAAKSTDPAIRLPAQAVLTAAAKGYADTFADRVVEV